MFVASTGLSGGLWLAPAVVPMPWTPVLWGGAVVLAMERVPAAYRRSPGLPSQISHMPERFGPFVIIVLGEAATATAAGVAEAW